MARKKQEFRQDAQASILKKLHLTRLQRLKLLKWAVYACVCILLLVIQDVLMSRIHYRGVTTDLVPMILLLITVLVGTEHGSIFVLLSSTFFWCAGSAPGPYCIAQLTILGLLATMIRQTYWRRGLRSTVLCAGVALMLYELSTFFIGWLFGLTLASRLGVFVFTGLVSWALMIPLYPLMYKIGKIGGEPWKE